MARTRKTIYPDPSKPTRRPGRPPRGAKEPVVAEPVSEPRKTWVDYLRLGESYTSLILGILVVIIASILLVSFVRNKNIGTVGAPQQEIATQRTQNIPNTASSGVITATPTVSTNPANGQNSTIQPTKPVVAQKAPAATAVPTQVMTQPKIVSGAVPKNLPVRYIVVAGDNLWKIAEKYYSSGYNWVDIAAANKLQNPGVLVAGEKLQLPKVASKLATISPTPSTQKNVAGPQSTMTGSTISGTSYTVVKGDNIWNIAVRAYGNGFRWTEIAKANPNVNPRVIFSGNVLKIPR